MNSESISDRLIISIWELFFLDLELRIRGLPPWTLLKSSSESDSRMLKESNHASSWHTPASKNYILTNQKRAQMEVRLAEFEIDSPLMSFWWCHCIWVRWKVKLETSDFRRVVPAVSTWNSLKAKSVVRFPFFPALPFGEPGILAEILLWHCLLLSLFLDDLGLPFDFDTQAPMMKFQFYKSQ